MSKKTKENSNTHVDLNKKVIQNKRQAMSKLKRIMKDNILEARNLNQKKMYDTISSKEITFAGGPAGVGKTYLVSHYALKAIIEKGTPYDGIVITKPLVEANGERIGFLPGPQPLDARVLTPSGWRLMGELQKGDSVVGEDGKHNKINKILPNGPKEVFKVTTSDGRVTECCADHLWNTQTLLDRKAERKGTTKSLLEIKNTLKDPRLGKRLNHFLPRVSPISYSKESHALLPYTLGSLLGDGSLCNTIVLSTTDKEIQERVHSEVVKLNCYTSYSGSINYNICHNSSNKKTARQVKITDTTTGRSEHYSRIGQAHKAHASIPITTLKDRCERGVTVEGKRYKFLDKQSKWCNPVKEELRKLGLLNKKSNSKFIPNSYKLGSAQQRLDLLRGLMDSDGSVKKSTGEASFYTCSKLLANDIMEIVRSLGGNASLSSRPPRSYFNKNMQTTIKGNYTQYIVSVALPEDLNPFYLNRKAMYFKSKYIKGIKIQSIEPVGIKDTQCIGVESDSNLYITDDFIVTHNSISEKTDPFMMSYWYNIRKFIGIDVMDILIHEKVIEVIPLAFMRGLTLDNKIVILDEAQNATPEQIKMFLTRIGDRSKYIICGDVEQTDRKDANGLADSIKRFTGMDEIGLCSFARDDIVRNSLISKILDKYRGEV